MNFGTAVSQKRQNMKREQHTIILITNYWTGFLHSIVWFATLIVMMAYAIYIESAAMEWLIGFMWILAVLGESIKRLNKVRLTLDEALEKLNDLKEQDTSDA